MPDRDRSDILASWFILALSSLHYCHTLLYLPLASSVTVACGNGLMILGDDPMRPFSPRFENKMMRGGDNCSNGLLDRSLSARPIQALRDNRSDI